MLNLFSTSHKRIVYVGVNKIPVLIHKKTGSRRVSITVKADGSVRVIYPMMVKDSYVAKLLESKVDWIEENIKFFASKHPVLTMRHSRIEYKKYSKDALVLVKEKLKYFNQYYNLEYGNITIKNQKTRWGSCSSRKNLSFNYKIIFLPPNLQDYLIVHELCHLKEMNHSKKFWDLVGEKILDYKKLSKSLRIGDFK